MSENASLSGLNPKQQKAIECLLSEPTTKAAAKAAGVVESTIHRWLGEPEFSAAYREARSRLLESVLTSLQAAGGEAVQTLRSVMKDETAPPAARVTAARSVIELSLRARSEIETEQRLAAIESQLQKGIRNENIGPNWKN